jgi:hypothetical protein
MVRSIVCWRPVCEDRHHPNLKTLEIGLFPHGILQKVPRSATFAASSPWVSVHRGFENLLWLSYPYSKPFAIARTTTGREQGGTRFR